MTAARIALVVAGAALVGWGAYTAATIVPPPELVWLVVWLAAAIVVHDGILVPVVAAARAALRRAGRRLPRVLVALIEAAFAVGAVLTLYVVPAIWAKTRAPDNPSLLPGPYGIRLALVWAVLVLVCALAAAAVLRLRAGRSGRLPAEGSTAADDA